MTTFITIALKSSPKDYRFPV